MAVLPQPPQLTGPLGTHLTRLNAAIAQALNGLAGEASPVSHVLLRSPNGTSYKITVDNSGNITAGTP